MAWRLHSGRKLPVARLTTLFPAGGQQGSTFEVTIDGVDLDDASRLHFSHPGITAQPLQIPLPSSGEAIWIPGRFLMTVAPDVPLGLYEVRAVGRHGISNPKPFLVGDLKELVEEAPTEESSHRDSSTWIALGMTVNGRADEDGVDHYQIQLDKGQRLIADCWAERMDSRMDATLAIADQEGRILAQSRDTNSFDPLLDFTAPEEGEYPSWHSPLAATINCFPDSQTAG